MRNDDGGSPGKKLFQSVANEDFRIGVDTGSGLVQDQDLGVVGQGPGKCQELFLPHRKRGASLSDLGVVASVQALDEPGSMGGLRRPTDLLIRYTLASETNVLGYAAGKEEDILQHDAYGTPQTLEVVIAYVDVVDQDFAFLERRRSGSAGL